MLMCFKSLKMFFFKAQLNQLYQIMYVYTCVVYDVVVVQKGNCERKLKS